MTISQPNGRVFLSVHLRIDCFDLILALFGTVLTSFGTVWPSLGPRNSVLGPRNSVLGPRNSHMGPWIWDPGIAVYGTLDMGPWDSCIWTLDMGPWARDIPPVGPWQYPPGIPTR